jgi:regulator of protease activity HflC (stomatin/prohibitin superfamily)
MSRERLVSTVSGWLVLLGLVAAMFAIGYSYYACIAGRPQPHVWGLIGTVFATLLWGFIACGFFTLQPNISAVLLLFGAYKGTNREPGFRWANPLLQKVKISLRQHNLNGEKLKVNDKRGNPIEIAVVVVWRVEDTAQACFDVQDYRQYVEVQSESAVRHLATRYPYDTIEQDEQSLRGSLDEVSAALKDELSDKLRDAGVVVDDARISHLAYASEIAGAMLRRQQAEAIVAARARIVEGAVGMVEMALTKLDEHHTVQLDEERRAAMVSNLLVVLCGEREATPVVNTGTLYG